MENTIILKDKNQLAERLMRGDKIRTVGLTDTYCFYDIELTNSVLHEGNSPFRYGNKDKSFDLDGFWACADCNTEWELVA